MFSFGLVIKTRQAEKHNTCVKIGITCETGNVLQSGIDYIFFHLHHSSRISNFFVSKPINCFTIPQFKPLTNPIKQSGPDRTSNEKATHPSFFNPLHTT